MSHSRIRRAEILLEFMRERKSEDTVLLMLEESLTFDLYYRENCKSRPSWHHHRQSLRSRQDITAKTA